MSTALVVRQDEEINLDDLQRMARLLVASGYFDAKGAPEVQIAQLATKILAGRELGYGPYTAVQGIHIIQGKPQISANLMAAAVKAHPRYDYRVRKMTDDEVAIEFFENKEKIGISTFSATDAKRAGTQNVQKYPRNMLFARALSNGVRWYCPDVFFGNSVYVEGEIGEVETEQPAYIIVDRESGEVIESPPSINSLDDVEELDPNPSPASADWAAIPGVPAGVTATEHAAQQRKTRPDWNNPNDAKAWAVEVGACANEFEASASLKKIVDASFGGKLNSKNIDAAMDKFFERQMEKLSEAVPA